MPARAVTVATVRDLLESWYPPVLAEPWDVVGLTVGSAQARVGRVLCAVDPTDSVIAEAAAQPDTLLVSHHPLLLGGVTRVDEESAAGRRVAALIRTGTALFVAHTNADRARPGVSDALARRVGIVGPLRAVVPADESATLLVTHVPADAAEPVRAALAAAGAGVRGGYRDAAFLGAGIGHFTPLAGASPARGDVGQLARVPEVRLEVLVPPAAQRAVLAALRATHPYELPSWHLATVGVAPGPDAAAGLGRVGDLAAPVTLAALARHCATVLPVGAAGVRGSGDADSQVRTVAVVGGSGSDVDDAARAAGAEVLVTADTKHHRTLDAALPVLDVGHAPSEQPWVDDVVSRLGAALPAVSVAASAVATTPWTLSAGAPSRGAVPDGRG